MRKVDTYILFNLIETNTMRNTPIGLRLGLGFGLLIVAMLVIAALGAWRMLASDKLGQDLHTHNQTQNLILRWVRYIDVNANLALVAADIRDEQLLQEIDQILADNSVKIEDYKERIRPELQGEQAHALFNTILATQQDYLNQRGQAMRQMRSGQATPQTNRFLTQELPIMVERYIGEMEALSAHQGQIVQGLADRNRKAMHFGMWLLIGVSLAVLVIGPWLAWRITRSISRPLREAVTLAEAVSERDLTQDLTPEGKDEVSQLQQALHHMTVELRKAVGDVQEGAQAIADASGEISARNMDLSARTQEQSSALAETASAMEEITSTVRQSADNAQQANGLALSAAKTATQGGDVVAELIDTMTEINQASQQVSEVINVIDSIAFQTNILALNAAVEAARAGEQGRGFAVVASEVRALAQRSATSAREIKSLIERSSSAVSRGNEQAARTNQSMNEVVTSIQRVTDLVGEISAATKEQTLGIEQINVAILQMDSVTRQNASLVDYSAHATQLLEEQADRLAVLVNTFKRERSIGGSQAPMALSN